MNDPRRWWRSIHAPVIAIALAGHILVPGPMVSAQQQSAQVPAPAVRVTVRLVLVDAVPTDKDGRMVTGMGAQDFTVLEDGKPQKVTMVSLEQPAEMARALGSRRGSLPPNVTTNRPEYSMPSGAPVILLLDALNTPVPDQGRVRMQLLKYLDTQLQSGQPVAVYTLARSLRLLQGFTDDPALVEAVVQSSSILQSRWSCNSPMSTKGCRGCPEQCRTYSAPIATGLCSFHEWRNSIMTKPVWRSICAWE